MGKDGIISSVAGNRGRGRNYLCGSAKGGVTTCLQGLRNRLHHAGVRVITAKPGFVDTRMNDGRPRLFLVASLEAVARRVHKAVQHGRNVVYAPWFWRVFIPVVGIIPERLFRRLLT